MTVSDITPYLIELERRGFTGEVRIQFHKGKVSKKLSKVVEEVELVEGD